MRRLLRAAALLAACLVPAVQAHLMPAGQGTVRLVGDSAYVVLAVPAALVAMADDDRDGGISAAEIDRHRTRIDAEISQRLQVLSQGQPGRLVFGDLLLSHPEELKGKGADQVTVARRYQWPQPVAGISVRALLAATDKDDTQILMRAIKGEVEGNEYTPYQVRIEYDAGGVTGVGIVEVFEVDTPATPLINIATRGAVLTGSDVMIAGFVIQGPGAQTVVVRARGPSLAQAGVAQPLANPLLQLFAGATSIASNDDWTVSGNAAAIQASGFAPPNPREAAILVTLQPGAYTAIVSGVAR